MSTLLSQKIQKLRIVPRCKGGDNSIDNLGICIKEANSAKSDMMLGDFISLCKDILQHHGYDVKKRPVSESN